MVDFPPTGIHLIIGGNGTGKTTLFKCIAGLETYQGSIRWNEGSARGTVSAAFDDSPAHPALSGMQNLCALLDRPIKRLRTENAAFDFLTSELMGKRAGSYSLGQRKKLSLTGALLSRTPYALLDEPTSALDGAGRSALTNSLQAAALTRCIIIADHFVEFYDGLATTLHEVARGGVHELPIRSLAGPKAKDTE